VLLVICLVGGVFIYTRSQATKVVTGQSGWCALSGVAQNSTLNLLHLAPASSTNAWAFGTIAQGGASGSIQLVPLFEHWNGTQWNTVSTADTTPLLNSLRNDLAHPLSETILMDSLSVVSADNIWAVGAVTAWQGRFSGNEFGHTLIEHWDGQQWRVVASPDGTPHGFNALHSVVAISPNDIWAVGASGPATEPAITPLLEHWDGSNWSLVQLPTSLHSALLNGIAATSANDIWAVGATEVARGSSDVPLAIHWDGHSWSTAPLSPDLDSGDFSMVKAISANDAWAVGTSGNQTGGAQTLIEYWNGTSWQIVTSPSPGSFYNSLYAASAVSASDVWAVGYDASSSWPTQTLVEHWNGTQWSA
ncbi:MAG: hypothetical protein ACRDHW_20905, partial [Ktedonobacteraceae bacterium]